MEWLFPVLLILGGVITLGFESVLHRYLKKHGDKHSGYYSLTEISDRFARREPLSWAMIAFGVFWSVTNLI